MFRATYQLRMIDTRGGNHNFVNLGSLYGASQWSPCMSFLQDGTSVIYKRCPNDLVGELRVLEGFNQRLRRLFEPKFKALRERQMAHVLYVLYVHSYAVVVALLIFFQHAPPSINYATRITAAITHNCLQQSRYKSAYVSHLLSRKRPVPRICEV
ncbi:uncharacterized protein BDZ99DRAFT_47212 [Mytilinidion resinicola]|uniref:Uncharacterized protein n=1 Tax=Mytilinidion resinicola TaxID=574789 RepID=A0A6A6YKZ9_9PEZI|nr:uncharacterized protein BDZ99DRAFT_47212 [Mytilinidion resinicola]KAF2809208.1 hypothetical protein BDZ99DRAFT_47212 [Mytilinidion resinicola]